MVTKLRLHFQGQRSALLLKTVVFLVTLWFAHTNGGAIPALLFAIAGIWAFVTPLDNVRAYKGSFAMLVVLSIASAMRGDVTLWVVVLPSILAYVIFGLKARYFIYRSRIHYFLALALTYGIFSLFFESDRSVWFVGKLALAGIGLFIVWSEFFGSTLSVSGGERIEGGKNQKKLRKILGALVTFVAIEVAWAASILPIGETNAANLSFIAAFITGDLLQKKIEGTLTRNAMLMSATIAVLAAILIFATSQW